MPVTKIDYVEFESSELGASRTFFTEAFGWEYTEYGSGYLAIDNAGLDGGLSKSEGKRKMPMVILIADDLEAAQRQVEKAGGKIAQEIFSFPGGRRFHFMEPGGNELAVWSKD